MTRVHGIGSLMAPVVVAGSMMASALPVPAFAQSAGNPTYQTFFGNTVCTQLTVNAFLARCLQTIDPNGKAADISAASESSLTPNQTAVAASNALASARALADVTEAKLESLRDEENGKPSTDTGKIATFGRWSVFSNISGEWFNQDRQAYSRERGFDGHRYGGTLGADYRLDEGSRIGVMVSYSQYSMNFDQELAAPGFTPPTDAGGMKSKTFSAVLFATGNFTDNAWIDAAGGFAWSDNDFRRNAVFQPANPRSPVTNTIVNTAGSANGRQWFVTLGAGYDFTDGALSIGPYVRGTYTHSKIDAYSEQDVGAVSGLAMRVAAQEAESFVGIAGARASYSIGTSWGVIVPQARVEYEHEFKDDARTTITRFVLDPSNTPLAVSSDAPDRNHFNLGATLSMVLPHGVITYVDYEALVGYSDFTRNRVTAGLRVEF